MDYIKSQINYWMKSAKRNLATAEDLFKSKHRDSCLFFCHLALEKLIKSVIVKNTKKFAPYIHDLAKLAALAELALDEKQVKNLRTITTFNIAARYDDVKLAFYKKCTPAFTKKYLSITKDLFKCIKKESPKKSKK